MTSRRRRLAALLLSGALTSLATVGCGDDPTWFEIATVGSSEPQVEPTPEAVDAGAAAVRDLAKRHDGWTATAGSDVVWSPLANARALAMVRAGATGELADALDDVLGAGSPEATGALGEAIRRDTGTTSTGDGTTTAEIELGDATAVWGPSGREWSDDYVDALGRSFGAGAWTVDVEHDPTRAAAELDAWAAELVGGEPGDLVPSQVLDADDQLLVTSALSLAAPWAEPTFLGATSFTSGDGSTADVDAIVTEGSFEVREGEGWRAVTLPLAGRRFGVTVLLPDDADGPALQEQLDELIDALATPGAEEQLTVVVPAIDRRDRTDAGPLAPALARPGSSLRGVTDDPAAAPTQVDGYFGGAALALSPAGLNLAGGTNRAAFAEDAGFVADRPFAIVVHHVATATPMLQALVTDLTSG